MNLNISDRDKRVLAGGGGLILLYLLVTLVIQPIFEKQKQIDRQIQNKIMFLEKYYEILNQKPYYDAKNKENKKTHISLDQQFLNEKKPGLAAASLQKLIEGFAQQSAVTIERVRVEKPKFIERLLAVPVRITLRSTMKNLSQLIYRIENNRKFLVVEEMISERINKTDPEILQSRLLISGFIRELEPESGKKI